MNGDTNIPSISLLARCISGLLSGYAQDEPPEGGPAGDVKKF